jgi:cobalt-zinc-cadmium efflux system protein
VEIALGELDGVETVHDLHVWPLSTTETALTAHLVVPDIESTDRLLEAAQRMLHDRFRIEHSTIQIERIHLEDARCC